MNACARCPLRARPCEGPCPCLVDNRNWFDHRDANYCPHPDGPRFGTGTKPPGWDAPEVKYVAPVYSDEEIETMREKDRLHGPCCEPPSA
jgi:hypothetical protein